MKNTKIAKHDKFFGKRCVAWLKTVEYPTMNYSILYESFLKKDLDLNGQYEYATIDNDLNETREYHSGLQPPKRLYVENMNGTFMFEKKFERKKPL